MRFVIVVVIFYWRVGFEGLWVRNKCLVDGVNLIFWVEFVSSRRFGAVWFFCLFCW